MCRQEDYEHLGRLVCALCGHAARHEGKRAVREGRCPECETCRRLDEYTMERECYRSLADELSGDPHFLRDADPDYVRGAKRCAAWLHLPWPPPADIDMANLMMDEAIERLDWLAQ